MRTWDVYAKSALVFLLGALATLALNHQFTRRLPDSTLRLALAFSLVQIAATTALAVYLIARRFCSRFYKNIGDQLRPALQENVSALAFGGRSWPGTVPKQGLARQVLEDCLAVALSGLRDSPRARLSQFAWDQGFARQWQQSCHSPSLSRRKRAIASLCSVIRAESAAVMHNALADPDPTIRAEAARALLAGGDPETVCQIFHFVLAESLLVRVLLTAHLKRHARLLLPAAIPAVLAAGQGPAAVHCLEILIAWKLAIPGFDITPLLERTQHLPLVAALLPYVPVPETVEDHLRAALEKSDLDIRCAAAHAAGQLKLQRLLPCLLPLLNLNARLAAAAAQAIAQMGPPGRSQLHAVLSSHNRNASAAALEALETLALGLP